MANFDPLSRAKKLAEQATQKAIDAKEIASQRAADVRELTAAKAEEAAALAADMRQQTSAKIGGLKDLLAEHIADVKGAAITAVKEMVDDFNEHLPALREAGYTVTDVSVELGLPPKVQATFAAAPDIAEERVAAVCEEHREAKVTVALLRALYAAYKMQNAIHVAGMRPRGIVLEIGITPAIGVKFA